MSSKIINEIRKKSREEWIKFFNSKITDLKNWSYGNVEKAVLLAFIFGIFFIVAAKFVLALIFLISISLFIIWKIALPADEINLKKENDVNDNDNEKK